MTKPRSIHSLTWLAWLGVFLIAPWILRCVHGLGATQWRDLRGYLSDAFFGLLLLLLLASALKKIWVSISAVMIWAAVHIGIFEHLVALGALPRFDQFGYLLDPIFLRGSVVPVLKSSTTWSLFALSVIAVSAVRRKPFPQWRVGWRRSRRSPLAVAVVLLLGLTFWPISRQAPSWRQAHHLELTVRDLAGNVAQALKTREKKKPNVFVGAELPEISTAPDLSGELRMPQAPGRDVILIMVEGISGGYFPSILEAHDLSRLPKFMHRTDQFIQSGLVYNSFINMQRQTNRGTYSVLCGQPPRLAGGLPKMTDLVKYKNEEVVDCLPERLRRAGYRTAYLQAAQLPFMLKDQFMPRAGFELVLGEQWFTEAYYRGEWGVDDKTFFEGGLDLIQDLRRDEQPYFLTLLTVGTHHPYSVPLDYVNAYPRGSFPWAVVYLDEVLEPFLQELKKMGVFEDTLVLLTSDEAVGLAQAQDDFNPMVSQAWGFLAVFNPDQETGMVSEPFMQTDVALSLLDYLQVDVDDPNALPFSGRSLFRSYEQPRTLAFGNVYLDRVAGVGPSGHLFGCKTDWQDCTKWRLEDGKIFSPHRIQEIVLPGDVGFLAAHVKGGQQTLASSADEGFGSTSNGAKPIEYSYHLVREDIVPLSVGDKQWVFGGQFLTIPAQSRLEVELEVTLKGEPSESATATIYHDLAVDVDQGPELYVKETVLKVGQKIHFSYAYQVGDEQIRRLDCRLWVTEPAESGLSLEFGRRNLKVVPAGAEDEDEDQARPQGLIRDDTKITQETVADPQSTR